MFQRRSRESAARASHSSSALQLDLSTLNLCFDRHGGQGDYCRGLQTVEDFDTREGVLLDEVKFK